jgi:hypothetical protein
MTVRDAENPPVRDNRHRALEVFLGKWRAEGTFLVLNEKELSCVPASFMTADPGHVFREPWQAPSSTIFHLECFFSHGFAVEKNLHRIGARREAVSTFEVELRHDYVARGHRLFRFVYQRAGVRPAHAHCAGTGAGGCNGKIDRVVRLEGRSMAGYRVVRVEGATELNRRDMKAGSAADAANEERQHGAEDGKPAHHHRGAIIVR